MVRINKESGKVNIQINSKIPLKDNKLWYSLHVIGEYNKVPKLDRSREVIILNEVEVIKILRVLNYNFNSENHFSEVLELLGSKLTTYEDFEKLLKKEKITYNLGIVV